MDNEPVNRSLEASEPAPAYEPPAFEVISLSCEVSAYAPEDEPLF